MEKDADKKDIPETTQLASATWRTAYTGKHNPEELIHNLKARNSHLEDFCYIIAHNLRTPVANMGNLCELMASATSVSEALEYSGKMQNLATFLDRTLDDLVQTLASVQTHDMPNETVNLAQVLQKVIDLMQADIIGANALISADFDAAPHINYPARYIESIYINLLSNSLKYRLDDNAPLVNIRSYIHNGWICIDFKDNGSGLDLEKHGKDLFRFGKSFHRHKDSRGIGLFMLKSQIESLGGQISVSGGEHTGLHFQLQLTPIQ